MHACALTRTISLSYRGISLIYVLLFHFPRAISSEQQFSPYIFEWAIYTPYYYIFNSMARKLPIQKCMGCSIEIALGKLNSV